MNFKKRNCKRKHLMGWADTYRYKIGKLKNGKTKRKNNLNLKKH